jgi:hypothetical protein
VSVGISSSDGQIGSQKSGLISAEFLEILAWASKRSSNLSPNKHAKSGTNKFIRVRTIRQSTAALERYEQPFSKIQRSCPRKGHRKWRRDGLHSLHGVSRDRFAHKRNDKMGKTVPNHLH